MSGAYDFSTGKHLCRTIDKMKHPKGPRPVACNHCGGPMALTEGGFIRMVCGKIVRRK